MSTFLSRMPRGGEPVAARSKVDVLRSIIETIGDTEIERPLKGAAEAALAAAIESEVQS